MKIKIDKNIPLAKGGRKDTPVDEGWRTKYFHFPITSLKIGDSFDTGIEYEYGKTISIKNACRSIAIKNNLKMRFSVRKWKNNIRVWRVKN